MWGLWRNMVVSSSLALEEWYAEADLLEPVSWLNEAFGLMRHLLDDELHKHVRLVLQVAKGCNGDVEEKLKTR